MCEQPAHCRLFHGVGDIPRSQLHQELFTRAGDGIEVLVDASKKVSWFKKFVGKTQYPVYLIHLIRDPRALARRWLLEFEEKSNLGRERWRSMRSNPCSFIQLAAADPLTVACRKWVDQNSEIADFIAGTGLPSIRVTYRDIALNSDEALARITDWLGLSYEPGQKAYWNFYHHGTEKPQYRQGGNDVIDTRWCDYFGAEDLARIEANKAVNSLLDRMNMTLSESGLIQNIIRT